MMNSSSLPPLPSYNVEPLPPLVPGIPDKYLTMILPIIAYWGVSLIFHAIDEWDLFPQYRLHTPAEVLKRNHVSRWEVLRDVILQQIVQTIFGIFLGMLDENPVIGMEDYDISVWAQRIRIAQRAVPNALALVGLDAQGIAKNMATSRPMLAACLAGGQYDLLQHTAQGVVPAFAAWEMMVAKALYWYGIPALQFGFAIFIVDTWQYFWHRAMHMNKWLYTTFHSRHHRLYVPYAYGALYNHPVEGFLLDTLGTGLAYLIVGMTPRQSMWFFTCSTIKTVDDHCGYALPFDPLQHLTSNNAGYHDVHHQSWGIKTNFSQPFFTFWDRLLGTVWTGGDVSARYERARLLAQSKVDADAEKKASITHSVPADSKTATTAPYDSELAAATPAAATKTTTQPIPSGKATNQAIGSRQQVLDDPSRAGGASIIREEAAEEREAQQLLRQQQQQQMLRRSPRKKSVSSTLASTPSAGLKGLRDRVNTSLHGRGSGVLGVESRR